MKKFLWTIAVAAGVIAGGPAIAQQPGFDTAGIVGGALEQVPRAVLVHGRRGSRPERQYLFYRSAQ
ncbi:hypothetical protein ACQ86N_05220 [Puia sp. P3]|uniref:hypothetical protein n=1 Tax=Puia sp. P3 TaxID=3423952 RepID=UPI003D67E3CE